MTWSMEVPTWISAPVVLRGLCRQVGRRDEVIRARHARRILGGLRPHSAGQHDVLAEWLERLVHIGELETPVRSIPGIQ